MLTLEPEFWPALSHDRGCKIWTVLITVDLGPVRCGRRRMGCWLSGRRVTPSMVAGWTESSQRSHASRNEASRPFLLPGKMRRVCGQSHFRGSAKSSPLLFKNKLGKRTPLSSSLCLSSLTSCLCAVCFTFNVSNIHEHFAKNVCRPHFTVKEPQRS